MKATKTQNLQLFCPFRKELRWVAKAVFKKLGPDYYRIRTQLSLEWVHKQPQGACVK